MLDSFPLFVSLQNNQSFLGITFKLMEQTYKLTDFSTLQLLSLLVFKLPHLWQMKNDLGANSSWLLNPSDSIIVVFHDFLLSIMTRYSRFFLYTFSPDLESAISPMSYSSLNDKCFSKPQSGLSL